MFRSLFKKIAGRRGVRMWAIIDLGLFAFSNLLVNIILVRHLGVSDYGVYATGFAIFMLVGVLYMSAVVEPMTVFGASDYRTDLRGYLGQI